MNRIHRWLCRSDYWRKTVQQRLPWILSNTNLGNHVLEIGPGPGVTTDLLRSSIERLTALELDSHLADALRFRTQGMNVDVVTGNATSMPFPSAHFSSAVSFTMLHHVPSPQLQDRLLREVRRVLQPGGFFLGCDSLENWFMRVIHIGDTLVPVNPDTFAARLEAAGLEVLEIKKNSAAFGFRARKPSSS